MGVDGKDFIATKDISFDRTITYNNGVNIPTDSKFKIAPTGKVLMCIEGGSAGRKIAITDRNVCFGNKLACFDTIIISDLYLFHILQSNEFLSIFKSSLSGIIGGVSINTLKNFIIPLPPIDEELRIVEKINSLEPLIIEYSFIEKKLSKLEEEFPKKLKKSILQYAIEGKLVKQDPNDEPASVLLERIKVEKERLIKEGKIKRDKNDSYIYQGDDKKYYENSPLNWSFIPLEKLCKVITCGYASTPKYKESGVPFISAKNVKPYKFLYRDYKFISEQLYRKIHANYKPEKGDILLTRVGAGIGEACIIDVEHDFGIYVSVTLIKLVMNEMNNWILNILQSPFGLRLSNSNTYGKDASQGNLNVKNVRQFLCPIPPIQEQKRILNKLRFINCLLDY